MPTTSIRTASTGALDWDAEDEEAEIAMDRVSTPRVPRRDRRSKSCRSGARKGFTELNTLPTDIDAVGEDKTPRRPLGTFCFAVCAMLSFGISSLALYPLLAQSGDDDALVSELSHLQAQHRNAPSFTQEALSGYRYTSPPPNPPPQEPSVARGLGR